MRLAGIIVAGILVGVASADRAVAQEPRPAYTVTKLTERIVELSIDGGGYPEKVIASVGRDGLLIVDSGARGTAPLLEEALRKLGKGMPKIVINTHSHIEHLGGNPVVGRGAVIVGHRNLRERYLHGVYAFGDFPVDALPNLTFTDTLTLHFNDEEIRLASFIGAHDDSDIAVWFTGSKVAVVGALCMGTHFPSIDADTADIRKYPEVTERLLNMLPDDVTLVPGHSADCSMAEGRRFLDMLRKTRAIVEAGIAKGKDLASLQGDDVLAAYASYESYVTRQDWVQYWYEALTSPRPEAPRPWGFVHEALVEHGAEAAVTRYSEVRRTRPRDYWFSHIDLMVMGRRLMRIKRHADAVLFLERCLVEYPGSQGAELSLSLLATCYDQLGQLARAEQYLSKYVAAAPKDEAARKRLADLRARIKR